MTLPLIDDPIPSGVVITDHYDAVRKRIGATSELRASVHLMEQGFDVYRSMGQHAAFDLVAHRKGALYRVEVKTISRRQRSSFIPGFAWPVNDEWDVLILVSDVKIFQFTSTSSQEEVRRVVADELCPEGRIINRRPPKGERLIDRAEAILRDCPEMAFTQEDMLRELTRRGWEPNRGRTSTPANLIGHTLRALYDKGVADRVGVGTYMLTEEQNR